MNACKTQYGIEKPMLKTTPITIQILFRYSIQDKIKMIKTFTEINHFNYFRTQVISI